MGLEIIDHLAITIKSPIQRANTGYKVLFTLVNITLLILTRSQYYPLFILLFLFSVMFINKIPIMKILPFLFYPLFFSGLFTLGMVHDLQIALWVITKTLAIASSMLLLVVTTPIFNLFSVLSKFFPKFLTDSLFFTYRAFFIFHQIVTNLLLTMKLKGGIGKWSFMKNLKNVGGAVAITFIKALDSAERTKEVFYIRGYTIGNIKLEKEQNSIWNLYPVILSVFTFLLYFFL